MNQVVVVVNTVRIIMLRNGPYLVQGAVVALGLLHKWNNVLEQLPNWNICLLQLLKFQRNWLCPEMLPILQATLKLVRKHLGHGEVEDIAEWVVELEKLTLDLRTMWACLSDDGKLVQLTEVTTTLATTLRSSLPNVQLPPLLLCGLLNQLLMIMEKDLPMRTLEVVVSCLTDLLP